MYETLRTTAAPGIGLTGILSAILTAITADRDYQ